MPEGVMTADGSALELERAQEIERNFARAMASDTPADVPAPPRREETVALPEPEKPRRGRPGKSDAPRTTKAAVAPSKSKTAPKPQTDAERKAGVQGLVQIGSAICLILDQRTPETDVSFKADAYVLASNAEPIADACVETAKANPAFGAALDKITKAGPYAALVGVMFSVGVQIAGNHGLAAAQMMGAQDPRAIVQAVEAQAA